jgi:probable poly-beta-1,6-N-acetyl-D-glucosamine export protein
MIRRLLLLNGLAAIGAVANHATGWSFTAMFWWADRYLPVTVPNFDQLGSFSYYFVRAIEQVIMFSVPAFLFVSGFFIAFATGRKANVEWSIIIARAKSLIIPYLLWSALIILFKVVQGAHYSPLTILTTLLFGRAAAPYYYVPLLLQYYLLSPLIIIPLARKNWRVLLVTTFLIQMVVLTAVYPQILGLHSPIAQTITRFTPSWFFPGHIFWFSIGVVVGFNLAPFKAWLQRVRWLLLSGAALFFVLAFVEFEWLFRQSGQPWLPPQFTLLDVAYAICFIFTFMAFEKARLPAQAQLSDVGTKSYGVYLVHAPVQEVTARLLYHFLPALLGVQLFFLPLLIVVGLLGPLALMGIQNRTPARRYYQYVFG